MSSRPILSRPRRTKVYDCNYDMGERYYRPVVDGLDRKYTGGRIAAPPIDGDLLFSSAAPSAVRRSLLRDEEPADILPRPRRPASLLNEYDTIFDSRGRVLGAGGRQLDDEADREFGASLRRIKESRAAFRDEVESARGADTYSDKLLDTMGLKTSSADDDSFFKKRSLKITSTVEDEVDAPSLTKWSAMKSAARRELDAVDVGGAAEARARKSRARLADLDAEMEDMAQKSAAREQRSANLRALMAEAEAIGTQQDAVSSVKVRAVKTEKKVTF